jgi:glycosyltransferase involved in cell wall biosynthesis
MRLLFVNYEFPPVGGGAAYASFATARELVALGHQVDFLTTAAEGHRGDEVLEGIHVHRVPSFRRGVHQAGFLGAFGFIAGAAARIGALTRRHDYQVCHYYFGLPTGILARVPGPHRRRPYVVSLRGSDVPGYDTALDRYHRLLRPLTRSIWKGAASVVANSGDLRRLALRTTPDLAIDVIHNGADAVAALPVRSEAREGLRVLTVSRLIARKGLDTLIRALAATPAGRLSLDIAGEGPDETILRRLAADCGVGDRVRFHGFVDRAGLRALRARADMFVLASRAESCSMALLEAMGAGLPLIATGVGGTLELVNDGSNGLLFDSGNVEQLTAAMNTLAGNPALRGRMAAANRGLVAERCTWLSVARRYERLFQLAAGLPVCGLQEESSGLTLLAETGDREAL